MVAISENVSFTASHDSMVLFIPIHAGKFVGSPGAPDSGSSVWFKSHKASFAWELWPHDHTLTTIWGFPVFHRMILISWQSFLFAVCVCTHDSPNLSWILPGLCCAVERWPHVIHVNRAVEKFRKKIKVGEIPHHSKASKDHLAWTSQNLLEY